jgi:transposase-like protein
VAGSRSSTPRPRVHRLAQRLAPEVLEELIQTYRDGTPTTHLAVTYQLSKTTAAKLLRDHGVPLRRQGLTAEQAEQAVELYESGLSLAQCGEKLGVHPSGVHVELKRTGVVMRSAHERGRRQRRS